MRKRGRIYSTLVVLCIEFCFLTLSCSAFFATQRILAIKRQIPAAISCDNEESIDAVELVKYHTRMAVEYAGTDAGLESLRVLSFLCQERQAYHFGNVKETKNSVVAPYRKLLPSNVTDSFMEQVRLMERNNWLSTNLDSVDNLPSLHLNLVSQGKPLFPIEGSVNYNEEELDDFQRGTQKLLSIVQSYIYEDLLPHAQKLLNSSDTVVSDIFLRRYGEEICDGASRDGISAHYDVFSKVTAVIALDNVAANGTNGLYTTAISDTTGETSNHASLRRFFPLECGDAVLHSWDILHGVNVEPGLDRTSLIVWFSTDNAIMDSHDDDEELQSEKSIAPWVSEDPRLANNNIVQFVFASALESARDSTFYDDTISASRLSPELLYLKSASERNSFALTRVGSLFSEEHENNISSQLEEEASALISSWEEPPTSVEPLLLIEDGEYKRIARRFWLEGALQGNPLAQVALGDEAMERAITENDEEQKCLAATLFGLAAQQAYEVGKDSLDRVISYEASNCKSEDEFLASPLLQIVQAVWND